MYSMWKVMCFLNLKPHKRIALHQIHKIMLFLATSYDPFNINIIKVKKKKKILHSKQNAGLNTTQRWVKYGQTK